jgi:putative ABC transport system substrate-binding protein
MEHRALKNVGDKFMNKIICIALGALLFALCSSAEAQQPKRVYRLGYLDPSTASTSAAYLDAFRQEMGKLGWIEGKNITIEYRFAEQRPERLPELAEELVRLNVDLIVATSTPPALAAKKATGTIPIVMANAGNPVAAGLVSSLARPGGNITGLTSLNTELAGKRLEILNEVVPRVTRVGVMWSGRILVSQKLQLKEIRAAALAMRLKLEEIEIDLKPEGVESAFQTATQKQLKALITTSARVIFAERRRIVELAGKNRLAAIYPQ